MITIGTKVAILPCDDYRNRFIGTQGIVQKYYHNKVGVKIDGCKNPESEFGVFWFREESLAVIPTNAIRDDAIRQIIFSGPKTIDEVYVSRPCEDGKKVCMIRVRDIKYIEPVELRCKHYIPNTGVNIR